MHVHDERKALWCRRRFVSEQQTSSTMVLTTIGRTPDVETITRWFQQSAVDASTMASIYMISWLWTLLPTMHHLTKHTSLNNAKHPAKLGYGSSWSAPGICKLVVTSLQTILSERDIPLLRRLCVLNKMNTITYLCVLQIIEIPASLIS